MADGLLGHSGFVGTTLQKQRSFDALYRSTNIDEMRGRSFDLVVCAAAPAQKWMANKEPEADRRSIEGIMARLETITCKTFVLVSTVDVFKTPVEVDEESAVDEAGLHAYGLHRRLLEKFVEQRFARSLVVRLPGLVGPGLRKNVIFDFLNDNDTHAIDSRGVFQFYPMVNLWYDIQRALDLGLDLLHLTAEPVSVGDISRLGFGRDFGVELANPPARYDFRSRHASAFSGSGAYQYSRKETLAAVRAYAQSEPTTLRKEVR